LIPSRASAHFSGAAVDAARTSQTGSWRAGLVLQSRAAPHGRVLAAGRSSEQMAAMRITLQCLLHHQRRARKALSHVCVTGRQPDRRAPITGGSPRAHEKPDAPSRQGRSAT
jgi:hypothetical protein